MFLSHELRRDRMRRVKVGREGGEDQETHSLHKSLVGKGFHSGLSASSPSSDSSDSLSAATLSWIQLIGSTQCNEPISPVHACSWNTTIFKAEILHQGNQSFLPKDVWQCRATFSLSQLEEMLLMGLGQGCYWTLYNAWESPPQQIITWLPSLYPVPIAPSLIFSPIPREGTALLLHHSAPIVKNPDIIFKIIVSKLSLKVWGGQEDSCALPWPTSKVVRW